MSYSKLHSSVVNSSLWTEPDHVRILFITLLAVCDRNGIVYGSKLGLSRLACLDPDDTDDAFKTLMSPDEDSSDRLRNPESEGRRIEEVAGGFRLLNFDYYRGLRNDDDRREQNRQAQARFKAAAKVSQGKPRSATVSRSKPRSAEKSPGNPISEADTEAYKREGGVEGESEGENAKPAATSAAPPRKRFQKPTVEEVEEFCKRKGYDVNATRFCAHYESKGWRVGNSPMKNWKAAVVTWVMRDEEARG